LKNNVTLIGMPGAGKSTVGVVLAKMLGYDFLDADLLIQAREGRLLWEIIAAEGDAGFRRIEEEVNASIEAERTVIATGGSVIYGPKAIEHLREISTVIYLRHSYEVIAGRLGDLQQRGVTLPAGWTLRDLYDERTPLYEKSAHITFDWLEGDIRETALGLAKILKTRQ
jgi:shikimate kinase